MRVFVGLVGLMVASVGLATEFVPLEGGVTWTYEAREPVTGSRYHAMSGPVMWNGLYGFSRTEIENGVPLATTHWARGDGDRVVLQGVDWGSDQNGGTWFFDPAPVFVAPDLEPQQALITTAGLWEVTEAGNQWYGEREVTVTCLDVYTIGIPGVGSFTAVEQSVSWADSPEPAPWAYGQYDVRTYGRGYGLCCVASTLNPDVVWDLVDVDGLETTAAPTAVLAASLTAAPSPFNPTTVFKLDLATACAMRLDIFDVRGRHVTTLADRAMTAGHHEIPWQPRGLASGMYVARLTAGQQQIITRVTLLE